MRTRRAWLVGVGLAAIPLSGVVMPPSLVTRVAMAADAIATPATLWGDFNHYVRIARPDLAQGSLTALMGSVDEAQLLDVVEKSEYKDYEDTLERALRIETLRAPVKELAGKLQSARIARSRDPERITGDIQKLAEGERPRLNAMARLKASGQYAAPILLATLLDEKKSELQPWVLAAMVHIGRPMVYPLSVALPQLEAVPQGQVAQVLGEIGYPRALPYLKQVLEDKQTEPSTRKVVEASFNMLATAGGVPRDVSAAELFLTLGENHYTAASRGQSLPGFDPSEGQGIVWSYDRAAGLIAVPVPAPVIGDVLSMRAARTALEINPRMDAALSLWLRANQRRLNRLPAGQADPSYPSSLRAPDFYLDAAGPIRQHDVLHRALDDNDPKLALDAIRALVNTAGTDALVNRQGTVQPLLRALSFPDRRVRFGAAFAMANSRPQAEFPGSYRVVPVLAEAVRQSEARFAVVVARDSVARNRLAASVKELGFEVLGSTSLAEIAPQIAAAPGIDLIVTDLSTEPTIATYRATRDDYKLAGAPILALTAPGEQYDVQRALEGETRLTAAAVAANDPNALRAAVEQASKNFAGSTIGAEEAQTFASHAIRLLREIAMGSSPVFKITDAQPALIEALSDKRSSVVMQSAEVLALIPTTEAQRALADAALDVTRPADLRLALLEGLAKSATGQGNKLTEIQNAKVLDLTKNAQGDMIPVAAKAHGALSLPTANVVQMISK